MRVDIADLENWMYVVKSSDNRDRILDAFSRGQLRSKIWLISNLEKIIDKPSSIEIHGGWISVLSNLLFNSNIPITKITSIDVDPSCHQQALTLNSCWVDKQKFFAVTSDMCSFQSNADVVINTSCEHISQHQYDTWLERLPTSSIIVLQSNDFDIPEHIRTAQSIQEFEYQSNLNVIYSGSLKLPLYTRFLIIGSKK